MKKIFLILILALLGLTAVSCSGSREYIISGDNLVSAQVEDQFGVYYEIFVSSFSDSNDDGYGDLQGLVQRLDYLNDGNPDSGLSLGVDGLWLMPIMPSPSYHKYDVTDYEAVDSKYGSIDDFSTLVTEADSRGIDIIIDLVLNHTSDQHPWFRAARQALIDGDTESKYLEYYTLVTEEEKEAGKTYYYFYGDYYYEGNFSSSMPELNMDSQYVRDEVLDILAFWYDLGVKGFRLDAAKYIYFGDDAKNIEFWNWFVSEAKKLRADTYIVAEVWSGDSLIRPYYECFSNFDFGMAQQSGAVSTVAKRYDDVNWYVSYINRYRELVEGVNPDAILTPFISNHDMDRAAGYLSLENYEMYSAASLYMLTYGNPFIYYGEEIGMKGSRGSANTDANRRLAMLWGDKDTVKDPVGSTYNSDLQVNGTVKSQIKDKDSLYNHYKKLIMLRNANPEIARGMYTALDFDGYSTFGGFLSTYENQTIGIFHNIGDESVTIDLSSYTDFTFLLVSGYAGPGEAALDGQTLTISGHTSVVLR